MAYRPPTQSHSVSNPVQDFNDGQGTWQTVKTKSIFSSDPSPWQQSALRRIMNPEVKEPVLKSGPKKFEDLKQEDFPTLGGKTVPVKSGVSKSSSTESMAERMKKKIKEEEEEEERLRKELEEQKEEEEKQRNALNSILPGTFVSNIRLMKRFENEQRHTYGSEDNEYENEYDLEYNEYEYEYRAKTPPFPQHAAYDAEYNNEYDDEENSY